MWSTVRRSAHEWAASICALRPLGASINVDGEADGIRYGQVLWGGTWDGELIGLAWDWREVRRNVIAMSDPMTVVSNLTLLDASGEGLSDSRRLMCLNSTIHQLDWQGPLMQHERSERLHRLAA